MKKKTFTLAVQLLIIMALAACSRRQQANTTPSPTPETEVASAIATVMVTVVVTATSPPTAVSGPVISVEPTITPPPTATTAPTTIPEPTTTPLPTPAPEPTPTETPAILGPDWLIYFNGFRAMSGLSPVTASEPLSQGSLWHSQYMVKNDDAIAHAEDPANPYYDQAGHQAAKNGNIFATSQIEANYIWSFNFWVSAPFHLVPMIDPRLQSVGYGNYNEAIGSVQMAAVMDVRSAEINPLPDVTYPIFFPGDGSSTWIVRHSLYEWPDPLESCPGFSRPTGAPIVLQIGDGSRVPQVSSHVLKIGDQTIETCLFDETSYRNSNGYAQSVGRIILDQRDAIVIMPRHPLAADQTYTVQVVVNGEVYTWSFSTVKKPGS
ncbi:MAG: hypothetical protein Kow0080_33340 [Candidatus Promineifilaceae bacterium]